MNNDNYRNHNDNNKGSFLKNFVLSPFKVIWRHYNITQMFGFYGMFPKIIFSTRRQTFIQQKYFEKRIRGNFPRRNFPQESSPRGDLARGSYPWGNLTRGHFPRGSSPDTFKLIEVDFFFNLLWQEIPDMRS